MNSIEFAEALGLKLYPWQREILNAIQKQERRRRMNDKKTQATREINKILARLEAETGSLIESVELRDVDITTIEDNGQQLSRTVFIDLRRAPGTRWAPL